MALCNKELIPTVKNGVFCMCLVSMHGCWKHDFCPTWNKILPSFQNMQQTYTDKDTAAEVQKPYFTFEINFNTTKNEHYECFYRSQLHLLGLFEIMIIYHTVPFPVSTQFKIKFVTFFVKNLNFHRIQIRVSRSSSWSPFRIPNGNSSKNVRNLFVTFSRNAG